MHVRYYSAKDGLSQNTVADFLQDDKGYIWMATWNGLEKFDGYTFRTISHILRTILALNTIVFANYKKPKGKHLVYYLQQPALSL